MLKYFMINNTLCQVLNIIMLEKKAQEQHRWMLPKNIVTVSLLLTLKKNLSTGITCYFSADSAE